MKLEKPILPYNLLNNQFLIQNSYNDDNYISGIDSNDIFYDIYINYNGNKNFKNFLKEIAGNRIGFDIFDDYNGFEPSNNKMNLSELFQGFLIMLKKFNFHDNMFDLSKGGICHKNLNGFNHKQYTFVCIRDPFDFEDNVGRNIHLQVLKKIKLVIRQTLLSIDSLVFEL